MATLDTCMVCKNDIRLRQDRIVCDGCAASTHRTCTGIGQTEYRLMKKNLLPMVQFMCPQCTINNSMNEPVAESTRMSFDLQDITMAYSNSVT